MKPKLKPDEVRKMEIVQASSFSAPFVENLKTSSSIYMAKIGELRADPSKALRVSRSDGYLITQLKTAAKRAGVKLLFSVDGDYVGIRLYYVNELQMAILKELRSVSLGHKLDDLRKRIPEGDIKTEIQGLSLSGLAVLGLDSIWKITDNGKTELARAGK